MERSDRVTSWRARWPRYVARILVLAWAGWWTFFGLASGLGEGLAPLGILIHTTVPGLIFMATAIVAWRWETVGGVALVLEGAIVLVGYAILFGRLPPATIALVLLTMAVPPLIAGSLFLLSRRRSTR